MMFIISVFTLLACSNSKKTQDSNATGSDNELNSEDSLALSFERTLCFGTCPAFKITINNDGTCYYEGFKFVDRLGKFKANISKEQMKEIQKEAERIGFFSMKDKYDATVTDVPSVITMISGPNGKKEIMNRFDGPQELRSFEDYLDSILLNLDWKSLD